MRYTLLALASAFTLASAQSPIALGENCTPGGTPCAGGANCYATNSGLQTRCGNFQASCTTDAQCAFNTCNQGFCNGFIASSPAAASPTAPSASTSAPGWRPAPSSTVVAAAGSLPLGATCNPNVDPSQCSGGAQCWASNAGLIATCGGFNAGCTSDAQCATNACMNKLCRGPIPSSAYNINKVSSTVVAQPSAAMNGTASVPQPTGTAVVNNGTVPAMQPTGTIVGTGSLTTATGQAQFTGAAAVENVKGGVLAIVMAAVAWAL